MAERMVTLERNTNETQIELTLDLTALAATRSIPGAAF